MSTPSAPERPSTPALATLAGAAAALSGLALYQWSELLVVRAGGTPACAVNGTFDCAAVWNSPFASRVHELLGLPVAGVGLLWGLTALALSLVVVVQTRRGNASAAFLSAIKLWAAAGLLACVTFIAASLQAKAVCFTCLGTYGLTALYGVGAFVLLPKPRWPDSSALVPAGAWVAVIAAPLFLGLLYPGSRTPRTVTQAPVVPVDSTATPAQLAQWMGNLTPEEKLQVAWARSVYLESTPRDVSNFPVRRRLGPTDAPVKVVEFTDVLCGHCRVFEQFLGLMVQRNPGLISVEPRYYPLDAECNPQLQASPHDGVRCLGAKVQLCLEQHPKFAELRHEIFEQQSTLSVDSLTALAGRAGLGREALEACVNSEETAQRLADDLTYAKMYGISGTPLVLVNGREAPAIPAFLVGLLLAKGDANAPVFSQLPPPPPSP